MYEELKVAPEESEPRITVGELKSNPDLPTPIYISPKLRMILLIAIGLIVIWLCITAPNVPRLIVLGATVSLILSFPVRLLSRWIPRRISILIVIVSTILFAILLLALIIPFAVNEISEFAERLPDTVSDLEGVLREILTDFYRRGIISDPPDAIIENLEETMFSQAQEIAETLLNNLATTLTGTFNLLITMFGVIFIATYLLVDIPRFRESFIRSFAPGYRPDAAILWKTLGDSLSRYLAGLSVSIAVQGLLVTIGLYFLEVPYAVILGLWMSATAILPYVGAFIGAIPAVLIALTISWELALGTVVLYIAVNQFDGNFVTPRVQANAVRVHPLLIFLAVIAGSQMGGALGAILAVPTLAVIRVLSEFFWVRLRVQGSQEDTLLSAMRNDLALERISNQTSTMPSELNLTPRRRRPKPRARTIVTVPRTRSKRRAAF